MVGKDILDIVGFDPLKVDLSIIKEATAKIPADGFIEVVDAGRLATVFLVAAEHCLELVAQAYRWSGYKDIEKKSQRAQAIARKMVGDKNKGIKALPATAAKEAFGDDTLYMEASKTFATATAWLEYITRQYELLNKYHHLCKGLISNDRASNSVSNWAEQGIHNSKDLEQTNKGGKKIVGPIDW